MRVARVYEPRQRGQGTRVLVDRLWPRGLHKDAADVDEWLKEVAPSSPLRIWYAHDRTKYKRFVIRYMDELDDEEHKESMERLRRFAKRGNLTLLTSVKDVDLSHAEVLRQLLA